MIPRLYITEPLEIGHSLHLNDAQLHYIRHVLRLNGGDHVHLFNGTDGEWQAQLDIFSKKAASLLCLKQLREQSKASPLTLMCALIKPARMELLIEKATELGVSDIMPLVTDHCAIRKMNTERLASHAIEAAEQSERLSVPEIHRLQSLREAITDYKGHILWADESRDQSATLYQTLETNPISAILIGPEGGFSELEKDYLRTRNNVYPVHMGSLILRAETAGIALISAYQSHSGAWR